MNKRSGTWGGVAPQCMLCSRRPPDALDVCEAFPGAIPDDILDNDHDHRRPWIDPDTGRPGDEGMALEGSLLFAPRADADPETLASLYADLERPRS